MQRCVARHRVVCKQCTSHVTFFSCLRTCVIICHTTLAQVFVRVISSMCHAPVCLISLRPSLLILLNIDFHLFLFHVDVAGARSPVHFAQRGVCPLANNAPLTGYEPNFFDDYHFSETTEIFLQESFSDTRPSYLHDAEIGDGGTRR